MNKKTKKPPRITSKNSNTSGKRTYARKSAATRSSSKSRSSTVNLAKQAKSKRKWLDERAEFSDETYTVADGFDAAITGIAYTHQGVRVVYDADTCVAVLVAGGMNALDAEEYFDFNVLNAYVGPQTPLFMSRAPAH